MFEIDNVFKDHKLERVSIDGKRFYVTPEGNKYPSVTTILSTMSAEKIAEWRNKIGHEEAQKISTQASRRGTSVHLLAEKYLRNDPDWAKDAMPSNIASFNNIKPYLDKWCSKVYANELTLYSDELKTAGQCDLIAQIHGIRTVGDFKTAKRAKKKEWILNYFYQCTAYALMLYEREKVWCPQICVMIATDEDGLQTFVERTNDYVPQVRQFFEQYHLNLTLLG